MAAKQVELSPEARAILAQGAAAAREVLREQHTTPLGRMTPEQQAELEAFLAAEETDQPE